MARTEGPTLELERTWELCQRIDIDPDKSERESRLLEPITCLLDAETAVFRIFSTNGSKPTLIVSLGIATAVHDAYLNRYFELDPIHGLLASRFGGPLFANQAIPGPRAQSCTRTQSQRWNHPRTAAMDFLQYRRQFLFPNNLYHHLGFRFQSPSRDKTFALDFHRARGSVPFHRLEFARARIVATLLHARAGQLCAGSFQDNDRDDAVSADRAVAIDASFGPDTSEGPLSPRELEVAETVALGLTNKEVAAALGISVRTVENHMRSIFAKLEIRTRTHLAAKLHDLPPH